MNWQGPLVWHARPRVLLRRGFKMSAAGYNRQKAGSDARDIMTARHGPWKHMYTCVHPRDKYAMHGLYFVAGLCSHHLWVTIKHIYTDGFNFNNSNCIHLNTEDNPLTNLIV